MCLQEKRGKIDNAIQSKIRKKRVRGKNSAPSPPEYALKRKSRTQIRENKNKFVSVVIFKGVIA